VTQPPFSGADLGDTADQVRRILGRHLHTRRFRKGTLLWREGETSGLLVAITTGRVKIYRLLPTGKAVTVFLFGPGDVFGFLPFLDGGAYPAYAQAIEHVEAEVLPRSVLLQALRADPDLAVALIALLGRRLRAAMDLIQGLSTPGVQSRVAAALLALVTENPPNAPLVIKLPVTAQEFAGAIGIAPETLSRELRHLEDAGILAREGPGRYRVLSLQGLEDAAAAPPLD
jgi:CRP/FNR family transcriptional regulator